MWAFLPLLCVSTIDGLKCLEGRWKGTASCADGQKTFFVKIKPQKPRENIKVSFTGPMFPTKKVLRVVRHPIYRGIHYVFSNLFDFGFNLTLEFMDSCALTTKGVQKFEDLEYYGAIDSENATFTYFSPGHTKCTAELRRIHRISLGEVVRRFFLGAIALGTLYFFFMKKFHPFSKKSLRFHLKKVALLPIDD